MGDGVILFCVPLYSRARVKVCIAEKHCTKRMADAVTHLMTPSVSAEHTDASIGSAERNKNK